MRAASSAHSLDHLVGECEQFRRNFEPKRLSSLEIDREDKFGRLLYWKIGRLGTFENFARIAAREPIIIRELAAIAHQTTGQNELAKFVDCWDHVVRGTAGFQFPLHSGHDRSFGDVGSNVRFARTDGRDACAASAARPCPGGADRGWQWLMMSSLRQL